MNQLSLRAQIELIGCLSLATIMVPFLPAAPHCPGNISGVTPRFVDGALIVIPVMINETGPYDFVVDTGNQLSVIEPSLALELHLKSRGTIGVISIASYAQASLTILESLDAVSHVVDKPLAIVQDLGEIKAADARIRGILENFLAHFDLLIDYFHRILCLDETTAMRERVQGEHIPLVTAKHPENECPFAERLVVPVHLSGSGNREILLQLDSGSDGPVLYSGSKERELKILDQATRQGANVSKFRQAYAVLPVQDMRFSFGSPSGRISFVTPVNPGKNIPNREEDGLLPTLLFQRVFISGPDHFVVFDPR